MKKLIITFFFIFFFLNQALSQEIYLLEVKLEDRVLILYKNQSEIKRYPVAVPKSNFYSLPQKGKIIKIVYDPWWYPTTKTRRYFFEKKGKFLPEAIPPNSPLNAMGKVKLIILFENNLKAPVRIHGTNDPSSIGKRVTRGCIRLRNEDILELGKIIEKYLPIEIIITE